MRRKKCMYILITVCALITICLLIACVLGVYYSSSKAESISQKANVTKTSTEFDRQVPTSVRFAKHDPQPNTTISMDQNPDETTSAMSVMILSSVDTTIPRMNQSFLEPSTPMMPPIQLQSSVPPSMNSTSAISAMILSSADTTIPSMKSSFPEPSTPIMPPMHLRISVSPSTYSTSPSISTTSTNAVTMFSSTVTTFSQSTTQIPASVPLSTTFSGINSISQSISTTLSSDTTTFSSKSFQPTTQITSSAPLLATISGISSIPPFACTSPTSATTPSSSTKYATTFIITTSSQNCSGVRNLALCRPANQSSTWGGWDASRVVDGNPDPNANHGSCCNNNDGPGGPNWLMVDLGRYYTIAYVVATNRGDGSITRMNNFIVGVTNTSSAIQAPVRGAYQLCGQYPYTATAGARMTVNCTANIPPAQYVIIQQPANGAGWMNFCELEVYSSNPSC